MQDLDPEEKSIMAQLDYYGWLLDKHAKHFDDFFQAEGYLRIGKGERRTPKTLRQRQLRHHCFMDIWIG